MDNKARYADSVELQWWRVRPQLVGTLVLLTTICLALWTDTPVRRWMVRQVAQAEMPDLQLFAHATHQ